MDISVYLASINLQETKFGSIEYSPGWVYSIGGKQICHTLNTEHTRGFYWDNRLKKQMPKGRSDLTYYQITRTVNSLTEKKKIGVGDPQPVIDEVWRKIPDLTWEQELVRLDDAGSSQWHANPFRYGWALPYYGLIARQSGRHEFVTPVIPKGLADKLKLDYSDWQTVSSAPVWWYFPKQKVLSQSKEDLGKVCLEVKRSQVVTKSMADYLQYHSATCIYKVGGSKEIIEAHQFRNRQPE